MPYSEMMKLIARYGGMLSCGWLPPAEPSAAGVHRCSGGPGGRTAASGAGGPDVAGRSAERAPVGCWPRRSGCAPAAALVSASPSPRRRSAEHVADCPGAPGIRAARFGQREGGLPVAAVGGADQVEQRVVLEMARSWPWQNTQPTGRSSRRTSGSRRCTAESSSRLRALRWRAVEDGLVEASGAPRSPSARRTAGTRRSARARSRTCPAAEAVRGAAEAEREARFVVDRTLLWR